MRPPDRPQSAGDLRRPCFRRSSWLRPVAPALCSPNHGGRRSTPCDEKVRAHAPGVVGCGFVAAVVARAREGAPAGLRWIAVDGGKELARGRRTGSGLRIAGSPMQGWAEALLAAACAALEGSRVRRRWPLPEMTEPERGSGLARGRVRRRRGSLAVAGIFGSPPSLRELASARTANGE